MSTPPKKITDSSADEPLGAKRKKAQTPYKPVLSTLVKRAMEDSVDDAIEAQQVMEALLNWLTEERQYHNEIMQQMAQYAPLDHRVVALLAAEKEILVRFSMADHYIARLALAVTRLERRLQYTLVNSRRAVPPPRERKKKRR